MELVRLRETVELVWVFCCSRTQRERCEKNETCVCVCFAYVFWWKTCTATFVRLLCEKKRTVNNRIAWT